MNDEELTDLLNRVDRLPVSFEKLQAVSGKPGSRRTGRYVMLSAFVVLTAAGGGLFLALSDYSVTEAPSGATDAPAVDFRSDAQSERGPVTLDPPTGRPGDIVRVYFADGALRGGVFTMSANDATYYLIAARSPDVTPTWSSSPIDVADVGRDGLDPDRIMIPSTAEPGQYEICPDSGAHRCVEFEVEP